VAFVSYPQVVPARYRRGGRKMVKRLSPALFGIALICFLLSWVTVSCEGKKLVTLSGINLMTGTTIEEPKKFRAARGYTYPHAEELKQYFEEGNKTKREALAILAFLVAIGGLGLSFLKGRKGMLGPAVAGAIGAILLFILSVKLNNDILKEGEGLLHLYYRVGFYLTLFLFLSAIGVNVYSMMPGKMSSLYLREGKQGGMKFCSQCGSKVSPDDTFCFECGHSLK
jgi:hypothetical protein